MSKIDELIQELCPDGVDYQELKRIGKRNHGTSITASQMKGIHKVGGEVRIFAGGNTIADVSLNDVPHKDIIWEPSIIVKSRGYIDFVYYDRPFSHKNELWSYTVNSESVNQKFVYYYLITHKERLQEVARATSVKIPQLSVADTDNLSVPIPPLPIQQEIVRILDSFTKLEAELEAELEARKKQYDFYRNQLLTPKEIDGKWFMNGKEVELKPLGELIFSLKTGLNPRKNFVLNPPDAKNYYVTVRELSGTSITIYDKTDRIDDDALVLINNRSNLDRGDVLFSGTGTIGRTALVKDKPKNWNIKEGVYTIKPNQNKVVSMYLIYSLNSQFSQKQIKDKTVGSPVCSIPMADLKKIIMPIPALSEQERLAAIIKKFDALVNDISIGLPAEIVARRKQYEYYRGKLLSFKNIAESQEA